MQLKQIQERIVKGLASGEAIWQNVTGKTLKKLDSSVETPADFDRKKHVDFLKRNRYAASAVAALLVVVVSSVFTLETGAISYQQTADIQLDNQVPTGSVVEVVRTQRMSWIPDSAQKEALNLNQIVEEVEQFSEPALKGYAIKINGKEYGFFATEGEAQAVIDKLKSTFTSGKDVLEASFKETVEVAAALKSAGRFKSYSVPDQAVEFILKGTDKEKIHVVETGENFWTISQKYQISVEDLELANPGITPEKLQIGTKVSLMVPASLVTVRTVEKAVYEEKIPFEVVYQEDANTYKGVNTVKATGSNGQREVIANVVRENGIEISRDILSEKIVSEPTTKVVVQGTKARPATVGSGTLARPVSRGTITSPFGTRWGRRHNGIDVGLSIGTAIKAADGGTVVFAGYDGGYGYTVRISHGSGMVTVYAHNSKLQVKKGDKVFKGQQIALSGNSGSSTGPHLHFEVRVNDVPMNPTKYIGSF